MSKYIPPHLRSTANGKNADGRFNADNNKSNAKSGFNADNRVNADYNRFNADNNKPNAKSGFNADNNSKFNADNNRFNANKADVNNRFNADRGNVAKNKYNDANNSFALLDDKTNKQSLNTPKQKTKNELNFPKLSNSSGADRVVGAWSKVSNVIYEAPIVEPKIIEHQAPAMSVPVATQNADANIDYFDSIISLSKLSQKQSTLDDVNRDPVSPISSDDNVTNPYYSDSPNDDYDGNDDDNYDSD